MTSKKNPHAVALGTLGGKVKGPSKARHATARRSAMIRWHGSDESKWPVKIEVVSIVCDNGPAWGSLKPAKSLSPMPNTKEKIK